MGRKELAQQVVGTLGSFVASGAFSAVYEHATDDNLVIMIGDIAKDIHKLRLMHHLGYVQSVTIIGAQHVTIMKRLIRMTYAPSAIRDLVSQFRHHYTKQEAYRQDDKLGMLLDFATNPVTPRNGAIHRASEWLYNQSGIRWGLDDHGGNWLYDPETGELVPSDIFNFWELGANAIDSYVDDSYMTTTKSDS